MLKYDKAVTARKLEKRETAEAVAFLTEAAVRLSVGQAGFPVSDCLQAAAEAAQSATEWADEAQLIEAELFGEGEV